MSDCAINIRILFWHFKIKLNGEKAVTFNQYLWWNEKFKSFIMPIWFCDFSPSMINWSKK